MATSPLHRNRLADEPSPYLRQHATNPVDWWPWDDAAFAEAKRRDVPVFLSIGYATCHWCHVMAHESFEDEGVAKLMNEAFVNIKVDREERPDIDDLYMAVCQATTGSGGWPLTVLLTPDKKPFFAGTYFPKETRHGRIGMTDLVPRVKETWSKDRKSLESQAQHFLDHVGQKDEEDEADLGPGVLDLCHRRLVERYDEQHGGFGGAPKFPSPHNLLFLLRRHRRTKDARTLKMVTATLHAMADGGIHDHVGGGFHRYSTDRAWLLPHFEKMLYDQALLAMAYTEGYQATGDARFQAIARGILGYVLRDLRDPKGGFRCAEDADSEGEEGRFYVWSRHELLEALGTEEGNLFCDVYGVREEGNFLDEATHRRTGANILHLPDPLEEAAVDRKIPLKALQERLATARARLLELRSHRTRPLLDDKVLTDWNGLAIAAFAKAAVAFGDVRYEKAASDAADFVWKEMRPRDRLVHRYKDGHKDRFSFIDDHAFLMWGLLELYDATQDPKHVERCLAVAKDLSHFRDKAGGYFQAPDDGESLGARRKESYDGALPSGNSVAAWCLFRLAHLTGEIKWRNEADAVLRAFSGALAKHPHAYGMMSIALDVALGPTKELVIAGDGAAATALLKTARTGYRPELVTMLQMPELAKVAPWTKDHKPKGKAAAFLCEGFACKAPVETAQELQALLAE